MLIRRLAVDIEATGAPSLQWRFTAVRLKRELREDARAFAVIDRATYLTLTLGVR